MRRKLALVLFVAVLGAAGAGGLRERARLLAMLPGEGHAAHGVKLEGHVVPDDAAAVDVARAVASERLDRPIQLVDGEAVVLTATLRELGATADVDWASHRALAVARSGTFRERIEDAMRAEAGSYDFAVPIELPAGELAARLANYKEEKDTRPRAARRFIHVDTNVPLSPNGYAASRDEITPHTEGLELDVYATADALLAAAAEGADRAAIVHHRSVPSATSDAVRAANVDVVVSTFETRYGGPVGRDKNLARAASLLDGMVIMPGENVSYNEVVGPRSVENGFFPAPEIYKGEMREGIGGGACQVASTLHAAAFFGGLEVVERRNHSRPSGYIRPGLDATVSFPVLDLRIKNPFDFPIVVRARATGGVMRFDLLGKAKKLDVTLATDTTSILSFKRKLEKAALPEGEFRLKQKGKRGMMIHRTRTLVPVAGGPAQIEESTDTYPATQEIWLVAPGLDAGALPAFQGGPDAAVAGGGA